MNLSQDFKVSYYDKGHIKLFKYFSVEFFFLNSYMHFILEKVLSHIEIQFADLLPN